MTDAAKLPYLRALLGLIGLFAILLWPLSRVWPGGFAWHDVGERSYYFEMICSLYLVLGIFLLLAARDPAANRSLIWFTVWSSVAHGGVMLFQSFGDSPHHLSHLAGDVPLLLIGAALLAWLASGAAAARP